MKKRTRDKRLTPRELKFIDALFVTTPPMNGSEAARAVGVSMTSCRVMAAKWLTRDNIKAEVERRRALIEHASEVTREKWTKKMAGFYNSDVRKMFTGPGDVVPISELGDDEAMMVEGFELVENFTKVGDQAEHTGYTKKVKLTPKLKAMLEFGKVMGWYTEKSKIELGASLEELVMASMKEKE